MKGLRGRSFKPRLLPTLLTIFMVTGLLWLGTWQVHRLHWKENLIATVEARTKAPPIDVTSLALAKDYNYRFAIARGVFQNEKSFYLLSISRSGEGGYHVLTPLRLDDDSFLLVDRGWIPYNLKKPPNQKAEFNEPQGPVDLRGILRLPSHGWFRSKDDVEHNSWYSVDLAAMATVAGLPYFRPYVLEVDVTSNTAPYPLGGQTLLVFPNNHFVYALTWYSLAIALLVIYGLSSFQKDDAN